MRKNVKLTSKKAPKKPEKENFFFFVKDQGEGAAGVAVIILKFAEIALTTIFALCLGIFAPLCIWFGVEDVDPFYALTAGIWFGSSVLYIAGLFVVMFGHSKIASVIHVFAAAGTLATYQGYRRLFAEFPELNNTSGLYMPCLFITVITITIMLLINVPKWIEKRVQKLNEKAPSIFDDEE